MTAYLSVDRMMFWLQVNSMILASACDVGCQEYARSLTSRGHHSRPIQGMIHTSGILQVGPDFDDYWPSGENILVRVMTL